MTPEPQPFPITMPTPCPTCGAPLIFAHTDGIPVPLDVRPMATYQLVIHKGVARATRSPAYVDHRAVCCGKEDRRGPIEHAKTPHTQEALETREDYLRRIMEEHTAACVGKTGTP